MQSQDLPRLFELQFRCRIECRQGAEGIAATLFTPFLDVATSGLPLKRMFRPACLSASRPRNFRRTRHAKKKRPSFRRTVAGGGEVHEL